MGEWLVMCKECQVITIYSDFNELPQELRNKFKSKAKGKLLETSKEAYVKFINELNKRGDKLVEDYINNNTKVQIEYSCGHIGCQFPRIYMSKHGCKACANENLINNLIGKQFGKLTVVKCMGKNKRGNYTWLCQCECGNIKVFNGNALARQTGQTISCGCYKSERMSLLSNEHKGEQHYNWQGGITTIARHLRILTKQWDKDVRLAYDKKCALTGVKCTTRNSAVHHLYGFNMIVLDAHTTHNIEVKSQVKDYTKEELQLLEDYVLECHKDTSNGVLLHDDAHKLFHRSKDNGGYGYGDNTPEQYEEFKQRYLNGEFNTEEHKDSDND